MKQSYPWRGALRGLALAGGLALALGASVRPVSAQIMDDHVFWKALADEFEYGPGPEERPLALDASFWIGGDYTRFWVKAEGEHSLAEAAGDVEMQFLYSRLIAPFWEVQVGPGFETVYGEDASRTRGLLILGLEGLAPYWFEVEPQLLVSHEGDISLALNASYELLFTQRLVLEPEIEASAAIQEVPEYGVGSGFNDLELAARLRYEFVREFAPYVGVVWERRFGDTADLARSAGENVDETRFVAGLRVWY
jgi:copper resistance protein B